MNLVRGNALVTPFRNDAFDAAFSSYVAEHFPDGPVPLFKEIHRVLKPGALFFVVVPFNNTFRRLVTNNALRFFYAIWRWKKKPLGFTEFRYEKKEMDAFLAQAGFEVERVLPDDYYLPWSKGLFVDVCDVGSFVKYEQKPAFEFGKFGLRIVRAIQSVGIWHSCEGIFYVTRTKK
jgi:SAM-dependent methyltransferase